MSATFRRTISTRTAAVVLAVSLATALFGCAGPRIVDDSYYLGNNSPRLELGTGTGPVLDA